MNRILILIILLGDHLIAQNGITNEKKIPFTIGESIQFHSSILKEDRTINIYLPAGYSKDSAKKYPVIYLLDGSADEDFIHVAGLVQFGSFPWIKMIPETIVIGIANVDRKRDFTFPTKNEKDKKDFPTTGGSENFIGFIEKELQPFVEKEYKTDSVRTIIGQSLGGLLATEILFKKPNLFDNYIIVSPSLWWDNESLLKLTPEEYSGTKSVYIAVGKEEEVMISDSRSLYAKLDALKKANTKLYYQFFEKLDHGNDLHLAVYDAFERIFKVKKDN